MFGVNNTPGGIHLLGRMQILVKPHGSIAFWFLDPSKIVLIALRFFLVVLPIMTLRILLFLLRLALALVAVFGNLIRLF